MKHSLVYFIVLGLFAVGCSKNSQSNKDNVNNFLPFDSAIKYVYDDSIKGDDAAMVEKTPVSWSQLESQDVALQELIQRLNDKALGFAYAWADSLDAETLTFYGKEPTKDLSALVEALGVTYNESITVEYKGTQHGSTLAESKGGKVLTWDQFLNADMSHSRLYGQVFQQRMQRLNGIVTRRYLLEASKKESIPMEEYVKDKILQGELSATEDDIKEFAKQKNISESDLTEDMMQRLKEIVLQKIRDEKIENYVAKNLIKSPVQVAFYRPERKISTQFLSDDIHHWGDSKNTPLVYIGHWRCDDCTSSLQTFLDLKDQWSDKVSGYLIHFFPERDRLARMETEAGFCVGSLDSKAYWTYIDEILKSTEEDSEAKINTAAKNAGVDFTAFRDCFLKRKFQDKVDAHLEYAKKLGLTSPPVIVFNDLILESNEPAEIQNQLQNMGLKNKASKGFWGRIKSFFGF